MASRAARTLRPGLEHVIDQQQVGVVQVEVDLRRPHQRRPAAAETDRPGRTLCPARRVHLCCQKARLPQTLSFRQGAWPTVRPACGMPTTPIFGRPACDKSAKDCLVQAAEASSFVRGRAAFSWRSSQCLPPVPWLFAVTRRLPGWQNPAKLTPYYRQPRPKRKDTEEQGNRRTSADYAD